MNKIDWNTEVEYEPNKTITLREHYKIHNEVASEDNGMKFFFQNLFLRHHLEKDFDKAKLLAFVSELLAETEKRTGKVTNVIPEEIVIEKATKWDVLNIIEEESGEIRLDKFLSLPTVHFVFSYLFLLRLPFAVKELGRVLLK